jgi:filamentous hemagglutinin family protein
MNAAPARILLPGMLCCLIGSAFANPTGPTVVSGTASFATGGNTLTVTNSPSAIINWQTFSIGTGEITRFNQQSSLSAVLNRVTTQNPSAILGALESNGRVFLINPNGIIFAPGSRIDVAGLVASALNMNDADFLAGRMLFSGGNGIVFQQGAINAQAGGPVYIVGSHVVNAGQINAPNGEVVLAAGETVELVNPGTPNLSVQITANANHAINLGQIAANAGRIGIFAGLVDQAGTLNANTAVATEDGRILLRATNDLRLAPGSTTSATGPGTSDIQTQSLAGTVTTTGAGIFSNTQGLGNTGTTTAPAPTTQTPVEGARTGGLVNPSLLSGETISTSGGINSAIVPGQTATFDSTVPTLITGVPTLTTSVPTLFTGVPTLTSSATMPTGAPIVTFGSPTVTTPTTSFAPLSSTTTSPAPAPFEATIPLR